MAASLTDSIGLGFSADSVLTAIEVLRGGQETDLDDVAWSN